MFPAPTSSLVIGSGKSYLSIVSNTFEYEFEKSKINGLCGLENIAIQLQRNIVPQILFEMTNYDDTHFIQLNSTILTIKSLITELNKMRNICVFRKSRKKDGQCFNENVIYKGLRDLHLLKTCLDQEGNMPVNILVDSDVIVENTQILKANVEEKIISKLQTQSHCKRHEKLQSNLHKPQNNPNFEKCCEIAKRGGEFKFDFKISDLKLYETIYEPLMNPLNYLQFDTDKIPTIQKKSNYCFSCLVCCCEVPCTNKRLNVTEHVTGSKHQKRITEKEVTESVKIYHEVWRTKAEIYQAHQVHFYPLRSQNCEYMMKCYLCNQGIALKSIEAHIKSSVHKNNLLQKPPTPLNELQILIYPEEFMNTRCNKVTPKKRVPSETNLVTKQNSKQGHRIVKSVVNPNSSSYKDALEIYFHNHLKYIEVNKDVLKCVPCNTHINNNISDLRVHLCSKIHMLKLPQLTTKKFYCDVCELTIKDNERWIKHLSNETHISKCNGINENHRSTLNEYFCFSCKMVLFGYEQSLKDHKKSQKSIELVNPIKELFKSVKILEARARELVQEANEVVDNSTPMLDCCTALETSLKTVYKDCKVYPFGSRVSGLGNKKSDLDVFVDIGNMYEGERNQDKESQENYVYTAVKVFRKLKNEFKNISAVAFARTPIVQLIHSSTSIDCDLSFRHGLSVENTKFLRFCIKLQPGLQNFILILKKWMLHCPITDGFSAYAVSMMAIFYFQLNKFLLPVYLLKQVTAAKFLNIDGWTIPKFEEVEAEMGLMKTNVSLCGENLKSILMGFFKYYSDFPFSTQVICPLLGYPVDKSNFFVHPDGRDLPVQMEEYIKKIPLPQSELFRIKSMCIQDPFDLSHNLTKAISSFGVQQFQSYCILSYNHLEENCL